MEKLTIEEIINCTKGELIKKGNDHQVKEIVIDNREVVDNCLFIPIIGEIHDGHKFMDPAYIAGCRNFLIDENHTFDRENINLIRVKDTTHALGDISRYYRQKFNIKMVGITGSVGKTSTKDIISSILSAKYKTLSTIGNLNNEIGIPKTLFNLDNSYEAGVLEMGMSFKGDIDYFTSIIKPDLAVISNIGMSHIENFSDQIGIFKAKMEIVNYFNEHNSLIINGDDKYLKTIKKEKYNYKVLSYGFEEDNDLYCTSYKIENGQIIFHCLINNKDEEFIIPSIAKHNIYNAMAGILVGLEMGLDINQIKEGLANFKLTEGRLTIINKKDLMIIDDSYNASADSIAAALQVLKTYKQRRVAILGDVLETGAYDEQIHRQIGKNIKGTVDFLITVGNSSKYILDEALKDGFNKENTCHFNNYEEAIKELKQILKENDIVLVKASHGMKLSEVVTYLKEISLK